MQGRYRIAARPLAAAWTPGAGLGSVRGPERIDRRGEVLQELRWIETAGGWKIHNEHDLRALRLRIGVISDTHGKLDPAVLRIFRGADRIIHAGDIGRLEVIAGLEAIAPVLAVEGNNDAFGRFPEERLETLAGRRVLVRHIVGELHQLSPRDRGRLADLRPDVVVFGHSHRPYRARLGPTLLFNPGSAGPLRFTLPRTVGLLWLEPGRMRTRIVHLE